MTFTESNTVEQMICDIVCGAGIEPNWHFVPHEKIPRQPQEVIVEPWLREALIRLNPEIAAQPDRAEEVMHRLRAIILAVRSDGLVRANEMMTAWMRGEQSMPFGERNEHSPIRLIDFENLSRNQFVVTRQYSYTAGSETRRADVVLLVNGLPLVIIEAKTPVRQAESWVDAALQLNENYERFVPELFVCDVFSGATEGKEWHYGGIGVPVKDWGPWNVSDSPGQQLTHPMHSVRNAVESMLRPYVVLDILSNFTVFATAGKGKRRSKIICRYQQYEATNQIVERVVAGHPKKGLIWHFQGSGKSLLMVFAAQKLRLHPRLKNPTVLIVVDRVDLDTQITGTFTAADIPNLEKAETREKLELFLSQDVRKILITTIFKFGEADGVLNQGSNIIVLVDEAHRTQEGDLGRKMRAALPNAFLFGLTGTPINRTDRNTFYAFGAEEDKNGYMSRYGFEESVRDKATLELHFEPRLVELHIDKEAIEEAYGKLTGELSDLDKDNLAKTAAKMAVLVKAPSRVRTVCEDIVGHFTSKVEPNGFKAMVVTFDRESCLTYKHELDKHLPAQTSEIVMTVNSGEPEYTSYDRSKDEEEKLLNRFRDPSDPLRILIVTAKLLTGFDAPILQAMYLDKPLKEHTLLQAICRVNRTYSDQKTHGLIVDYIGIFDDVSRALEFDDKTVTRVVSNINELVQHLPGAIQHCLAFFQGVDRNVPGYEGLILAQECLKGNETKDRFAERYVILSRIWEALSPDPALERYKVDYRWLSQVYQSVQPSSGQGRLIWHALGAKTIELIHENVYVEALRDDLETLVLDAGLLEAVLRHPDVKEVKRIELQVSRRLRGHIGDPKYKPLAERLDALKERQERGLLNSVDFLKELLQLAKDLLEVEKETPPLVNEDRGKAALSELFEQVRSKNTPVMVERIVTDIDQIVRLVRFPDWQNTISGQREVKLALRKTLLKYKLHQDAELFEKAYGYVRQYY
jgi:type I restriction enzyme R subunit